jgi:hypothetical protein
MVRQIDVIDVETAEVLKRRARLAAALPRDGAPMGSAFPGSFHVHDVVARYQRAFGDPGELVARAVMNAGLKSESVEQQGGPAEPDELGREIDEIDHEIIVLLTRRCELVRRLPPRRAPEVSRRIDTVVTVYRQALGGAGELVGRSVINLARAVRRQVGTWSA